MFNKKYQTTKYIVIGNGEEWCRYSWEGSVDDDRIVFFNGLDDILKEKSWKFFCKKHFTFTRDYCKSLPFRYLWYDSIYKAFNFSPENEYRFIFYDWGALVKDFCFVEYLRKRLPKAKFSYLFSNIVKVSGALRYGSLNSLKRHFDYVFAFDKLDADKYGFEFSPLIYTRNPHYVERNKDIDVFYVGNAKDRLDTLHMIYRKCEDAGLKCCFFINGVEKDNQLYPGVHYNTRLSYKDVLAFISRSKCMVDAIQGDSTAMTIKVCETVIYDKKLITTNMNIVNEPYYRESSFLLFDISANVEAFVKGVTSSFRNEEKEVFSPNALFRKIK